jgi:ParB/Sulfiredoxin domain
LLGDRAVVEREGLPHTYRMRADAHYVDQLESAASGPAIRMVSTRQIDCASPASLEGLDALTQSIAAHGLVQPLIVRRQNGRYKLIAGRKRLSAAIAAGLNAVPCLLHDLEENAAAWIAEADNLRAGEPPAAPRQTPGTEPIEQLIDLLAADLSTIAISTLLLNRAGGYPQQIVTDLIQAQAWRASWLINSARRQHTVGRPVPVATIIARVCAGFQPQARITGLQIDTNVTPTALSWTLYEEPAAVALTGCLFATLSWLEGVEAPRVEIRAEANHTRALQIEVSQRLASVPQDMERYLRDSSPADRAVDAIASRALQSARSIAALQGGSVELVLGNRQSTIRMTVTRPNAN